MTNIAPQCPISRNGLPQGSHVQPSGITVDALPPVHNLREVINAINRMNTVIQHITHTLTINNIGQPYQPPGPVPGYGRYTWKEVYRTYTEQEVVNPDNDTQRIKINVLSSVYWQESTTGHQLAYGGP